MFKDFFVINFQAHHIPQLNQQQLYQQQQLLQLQREQQQLQIKQAILKIIISEHKDSFSLYSTSNCDFNFLGGFNGRFFLGEVGGVIKLSWPYENLQ